MKSARTVYVVTDVRRPLGERAWDLTLTVIAWLLLALAVLGHTVIVVAGALDALITAAVGTRRIGYTARLLRDTVRDSREEDQ